MTKTHLTAAALAGAIGLGCGGGSGSSPSPAPQPSPAGPCPAPAQLAATAPAAPSDASKRQGVYGDIGWTLLDSLWIHRTAVERGLVLRAGATSEDVGELVVLRDEGDLVLRPNNFDLRGTGVTFLPNASGGYDAAGADAAFRTTLGTRVTLADDDSRRVTLPFGFPFFGGSHSNGFVNSDGNITFDEEDRSSTPRNLTRLLAGPPRVAPFLADLDPSAGGQVFVHAAADGFTVTWCGVPGFQSTLTTTVQTTLLPTGVVEMKFGDPLTLVESVIVGVSPGRTGTFRSVDLSSAGSTAGGSAAAGERFGFRGELDVVAIARRFFEDHGDSFDDLVIWTDTPFTVQTFAYELLVANEIRGIGQPIFDATRDFGSRGRLRSLVVMDWLGKYPDDPREKFLGENHTLSVLGQETGHRWLAFLRFRDHNRQTSEALLGRDRAHWSFFVDTDASVLEGNDIEDLGGGSFRTVAAVERYGPLDRYVMGLIDAADVEPFFWVESPANVTPFKSPFSGPEVGVTFNGTRRDVLVEDIIAVMGARRPRAAESPRVLRQAFVYVATRGPADPGQLAKLDRIRRAWAGFFRDATGGLMRVETELR